jgi:hypothetical protein
LTSFGDEHLAADDERSRKARKGGAPRAASETAELDEIRASRWPATMRQLSTPKRALDDSEGALNGYRLAERLR